jgi:signal transduction histidine kinase
VVGRNLDILHANRAAQALFSRSPNRPADRVEFSDLPQPLASRVFEALKTSRSEAPFKYRQAGEPAVVYQVNISQFRRENASSPNAVLMIVEDITHHEKARMFEIQEANHHLLKTMAEQLAHEIGNSLVPLSTHEQLLAGQMADPKFIESLRGVLAEGVRRIGRLSSQMLYFAVAEFDRQDSIPVRELLEEAFAEAQASFGAEGGRMAIDDELTAPPILGNRRALRHAVSEILLNALQANPEDPQVRVRYRGNHGGNGSPLLLVEIVDRGKGFTSEAIQKAFDPFYTSRPVGLGLGLTVAGQIVRAHQGRIEIPHLTGVPGGTVRVLLPQAKPAGHAPALNRNGASEVLVHGSV